MKYYMDGGDKPPQGWKPGDKKPKPVEPNPPGQPQEPTEPEPQK